MLAGRLIHFLTLIYIILIVGQFNAQNKGDVQNPTHFSEYDFSQYISYKQDAPQNIINLDNNGDILLACIPGKTLDEIKSLGIDFKESQIRLLKDWRLLKEEGETLKTSFPILNTDRTEELRKLSRNTASNLGSKLSAQIHQLAKELKLLEREKNIYTILFSYVMDHLVWDRFVENDLLTERKITVEEPFWNGVLWAVYPPRNFSCGTNSITEKGISLKVNWSEKTIKKMIPFVADWKNFGKMFDDLVQKGKVEDDSAKKVFSPFNLFDLSGHFTVPVIEEKSGNDLFEICDSLSEKIAAEIPRLINLSELGSSFDFCSEEETLVILYHELMWDLLDYFEEQGLIQKPVAFENPDEAESKDIADLVFIVKELQ